MRVCVEMESACAVFEVRNDRQIAVRANGRGQSDEGSAGGANRTALRGLIEEMLHTVIQGHPHCGDSTMSDWNAIRAFTER